MLDRDIRTLLRETYLKKYDDGESRVVEEMGLSAHTVRIDIGVINGSFVGYEIKSEHDNLDRLPKQMAVYDQIFDNITLISGAKHVEKLRKLLPAHWGLIVPVVENGEHRFHIEKEPAQNPGQDPYMIASLLWQEEAVALLQPHGIKGLGRLRRWELWQKIAEHFTLEEVSGHVRRIIKARVDWREPMS